MHERSTIRRTRVASAPGPGRTRKGGSVQREVLAVQQAAGNRATAAALQRFVSTEHKLLGDVPTGARGVLPITLADRQVTLTQGDVVALSGDWFRPDDHPVDGLFHLATQPGKGGGGVGTADEIAYAIQHFRAEEHQAPDPRFVGVKPSDDVRDKVEARYRNLAAANAGHFVAPRGRGPDGQPLPGPASEVSAGSNYRSLHERAIRDAFGFGRSGAPITAAIAREAAAQHFLTDSFSAGHLRTPAAAIREFWLAKYPLFWFNLKNKIALDTASELNRQDTNLASILGTVQMMYESIIAKINEVTASYPQISLGDLMAKVFHDYDNLVGLDVGPGRVFGDDTLLKHPELLARGDNLTVELAHAAVLAGNADVEIAHGLGADPAHPADDAAVYTAVKTRSGMTGDQYKPESMVPTPTAANQPQQWQAPNFETLWDQPVEQGGTYTVGDMVQFELTPGSEIYGQLEALGEKFPPEDNTVPLNPLHPQRAYRNGFLAPIVANPLRGMLEILHWSPSQGDLRSVDRDDVAMITASQLTDAELAGMTTPARIEYVRQLIDGHCADDEEQMVVRLFQTAPAAERPEIYRVIEGHPWTGNWIEGIFVDDDEIYNAIDDDDRLERVRALINQGAGLSPEVRPTPTSPVHPVDERAAPTPPPDRGRTEPRPPGPVPPGPVPPGPVPPSPEAECPVGPLPHPLVLLGSTGVAVEELQCKLNRTGASVLDLTVDRIFGPRTKGAVAAFQRRNSLDVDGVAGPATRQALGAPDHPTVRRGSTGAAVADVQEALNASGVPSTPVAVDGTVDEDTEGAIVAFQDDAGLTVDGKAGTATWAALDERTSGGP